jgi:hypothetical protein
MPGHAVYTIAKNAGKCIKKCAMKDAWKLFDRFAWDLRIEVGGGQTQVATAHAVGAANGVQATNPILKTVFDLRGNQMARANAKLAAEIACGVAHANFQELHHNGLSPNSFARP